MEVGLGKVPGTTIMSGIGEFESGKVDVAGIDVCRSESIGGPRRLPQPADIGEQLTLESSSASDGVAGIGMHTARIEYLDGTGAEQTEDIITNGTTGVDTVATDIRFVNDLYGVDKGSNEVAVGNITIYKKGGSIANDLYNMIAAGGNRSLVPHRMVPIGKTLILMGWHAEEANGRRAAFRIRSTDMNGIRLPGIFCFKGVAYLNQFASGPKGLHATPVPALSVVKVSYWAVAVNAEGSTDWWGYLVDDPPA